MKTILFKSLVMRKVEHTAFQNLSEKKEKGKKGCLLQYKSKKMADFLHPECDISLLDQYEMFLIRSEMNDFPSNFGNTTMCTMGCLEILNIEHVITCPRLTETGKTISKYNNILNGSMKLKLIIYNNFEENNTKRINLLRDSVNLVYTGNPLS